MTGVCVCVCVCALLDRAIQMKSRELHRSVYKIV